MNEQEKTKSFLDRGQSTATLYVDDLDQNQSICIHGVSLPVGRFSIEELDFTIQIAQSFIPTKEILHR